MAFASEELERMVNNAHGGALDKNTCEKLVKALNYCTNVNPNTIEKLLDICLRDPKGDEEWATAALKVVSIVTKKVAAGEFFSKPDLRPSMLNLLLMLNTSIYSSKSDKIKIMYFKALISYPNKTYCDLEEDGKILEVFNLYVHQQIPLELRSQPIHVLYKYLKALPREKRLKFVEKEINVWFLKLVPNIMSFAKILDFEIETPLATLELIVDELISVDYCDDPSFQSILQSFYEPQKYSIIMKNLLGKGSNIWHRLWIIFIKILKNQLTKSGSSGSPINSLLPVVETAFKMDVTNRCRAFHCWNALIDNFATETNEAYINKRIKLLVIPLYSNNAKVEETVIAKINTWWHLICSYYSKLSNFAEIILIPFLHFCFGKPSDCSKSVQIPGMLTENTKVYCVEALVNIIGHNSCNGCVSLPVLKDKILINRCLLASKKDLVYAMNAAIKISANNSSKLRQPYKCAWMTLITLIFDTTDDNLRRTLVIDILEMTENLVQDIHGEILADIVLNDLIFTLIKEGEKIVHLLSHSDKHNSKIQNIGKMLLTLFDNEWARNSKSMALENLRPFTDFVVQHCLHITIIEAFLKQLLPFGKQKTKTLSFDKALVLWKAITSCICEKNIDTSPEILNALLLWPLKNLELFGNVEYATSTWFALLDFVDVKLGVSNINEEITKVLNDFDEQKNENTTFILNAAISLLSKKLAANNEKYKPELLLTYNFAKQFTGLNHTHKVFEKLLDIHIKLFKKLLTDTDLKIAKEVFLMLQFVLSILHNAFEKAIEVDAVLLRKTEQVLRLVPELLKLECYSVLKEIVLKEFLDYAQSFGKQKSLKDTILNILQTFLKSLDNDHPSLISIKNIMAILNEDTNKIVSIDKPKSTTPVNKKGKKKQASIVDTVVEDGEKFVVVKSNWKFNPKKLTENQKEKLKRKREDIPALYQDLSQSQDNFTLSTWKTDSQDTTATTSSSKSIVNDLTTSEKVTSVLKNMANTDVVPKILKNILTENNEKINSSPESTNENIDEIKSPVNKGAKPRLSIKDRIVRNVKMLTERPDGQNYEKHINAATDNVVPKLKTPVGKGIKTPDANSAPPEINGELHLNAATDNIVPKSKTPVGKEIKTSDSNSAKPETKDEKHINAATDNVAPKLKTLVGKAIKTPDANSAPLEINDEIHLNAATDNIVPKSKTPVGKEIKTSDVNSASAELNAERPSRQRRKPKKFAEMEIFTGKKRRKSLSNSESQDKDSCEDFKNCQVVVVPLKGEKIKNSEVEEINSNTPIVDVSKDILDADMVVETKDNDAQRKNNFIVAHNKRTQDDDVANQQENNKSVVAPETLKLGEETNVSTGDSTLATVDKSQTENTQLAPKEERLMQTPSTKKSVHKKSRIEKELAIDMVEGHPFLKAQQEKRLTRRKASESPMVSRRKNLSQKLNKSKTEQKNTPKVDKKQEKQSDKSKEFDAFADSQESIILDENGSQDFIESSQDSTLSIMSVKSAKTPNRIPVETIKNIDQKVIVDTHNCSYKSISAHSTTVNDSHNDNNDDSDFPRNKTVEEHVEIDLTENLDTEPMHTEQLITDEVIIINDEEPPINNDEEPPIAVKGDSTYMDMDTQDIADADTQPMDSDNIRTIQLENITSNNETKSLDVSKLQEHVMDSITIVDTSPSQTQVETTKSLTESLLCATEKQDESLSKLSPKDEKQRKQDFLNNTSEISPIKTLSPIRDDKSPSPETSSEFDVIKLSSPVQSNGEPFEKCDSPEIFTEEKVSPDKRDQSPPREEAKVTTASPRSLSLKKNKPQVRAGGRAAQMLGLCIPEPDRLQTIINSEKSVEAEEVKKCSPKTSTARRNLRILYNSTNDNSQTSEEADESSNFLKMKRSLPAADSSPSVPILKRKLADIADDSTVSPANKRKRVSFHDPPVSTTVCVKKYIEAGSVRSPQNSATKRQERRAIRSKLEAGGNFNSQKRLDTVFHLDTALTKAVESFNDSNVTPSEVTPMEDTEMSSLEPTPLVEVVKNSELNDVDPICLDLVDCSDPVDNIAGDLSSAAMRPLLVKEFAGKIDTVGDLAKLTELEVNRLCIKAPKVQVVKKVLTEYAKKINIVANEMTPMTEEAFSESTVMESKAMDVEMQTDCIAVESVEMQTESLAVSVASTQTNIVSTVECDVQTDESGSKSTEDIAKSLLEKPDFCDHLNKLLDVPSKQSIASSLPFNVLTETLLEMQNATSSTNDIIDKLLEKQTEFIDGQNDDPRLSFMREYLIKRFSSKDLILLCSDLLKKVHDSSI